MGNKKTKKSPLVIVFYILSAVMAAVFVYMVASTMSYINMTMQAYGMSISDMWVEALQQIVASSVNFLAYAVVIFGIAKIIGRLDAMKAAADETDEEIPAEAVKAAEDEAAEAEAENEVEAAPEAEETENKEA